MNKIDKRVSYKLVFDTETCPIEKDFEGDICNNALVYDFGYAVVDKKGHVYEVGSFVVDEVFFGEYDKMRSAYYYNKLPLYYKRLAEGYAQNLPLVKIKSKVWDVIKRYNIKEIYAHNIRFDYIALNKTIDYITEGEVKYFFPYEVNFCDTMIMFRSVIAQRDSFKAFCENNGYLTKANKPQVKAEVCFRYITKDLTFDEEHTGLEDVLIEKDILAYCYKQHKKMKKIFGKQRV